MIKSGTISKAASDKIAEVARALSGVFRSRVATVETRKIVEAFRLPGSPIREIVIVADGEDFPAVVTILAWDPYVDEELGCVVFRTVGELFRKVGKENRVTSLRHARDLALSEIIRVVPHPDDRQHVSPDWRPYLIPVDGIRQESRCRVIYEPPICYISFAETDGFYMREHRFHPVAEGEECRVTG